MLIKAIVRRMLAMSQAAWYIFIGSIRICCLLLFAAFVLLLAWDGNMTENYALYMSAASLQETAQAVLLIAMIVSVCVEDRYS